MMMPAGNESEQIQSQAGETRRGRLHVRGLIRTFPNEGLCPLPLITLFFFDFDFLFSGWLTKHFLCLFGWKVHKSYFDRTAVSSHKAYDYQNSTDTFLNTKICKWDYLTAWKFLLLTLGGSVHSSLRPKQTSGASICNQSSPFSFSAFILFNISCLWFLGDFQKEMKKLFKDVSLFFCILWAFVPTDFVCFQFFPHRFQLLIIHSCLI